MQDSDQSTWRLSDADAFSPLMATPMVFGAAILEGPDGPIRIVLDREGALPDLDLALCDLALTTRPDASGPWVSIAPPRLDGALARIEQTIAASPIASYVLARILRLDDSLSFEAACECESLAYSALLGGAEFRAWRDRGSPPGATVTSREPVRYEREGDRVTLTLASPDSRNAMSAAMRDALFEALASVLDDPSRPQVTLRGEGRCFSIGGALDEFGSNSDLAQAHVIRIQRSCTRLLHAIGNRAEVVLHGACVGSGIEIPAAAARRLGTRDTIVWLPEVGMGLIPGAGGTVTLARAIGRHRLLWLCLSGERIGAQRALEWGLLHEIIA